tara:strand:- start:279 stop:539 length:261 start_codon:yes stop_codon:yes gene_type:complete
MDKIINKINDDIREIQINPCYEVSLIGCSIYAHFRSVVKLYDDCNNGGLIEKSEIPLILKRDILELGAKIKVINEYLNKKGNKQNA